MKKTHIITKEQVDINGNYIGNVDLSNFDGDLEIDIEKYSLPSYYTNLNYINFNCLKVSGFINFGSSWSINCKGNIEAERINCASIKTEAGDISAKTINAILIVCQGNIEVNEFFVLRTLANNINIGDLVECRTLRVYNNIIVNNSILAECWIEAGENIIVKNGYIKVRDSIKAGKNIEVGGDIKTSCDYYSRAPLTLCWAGGDIKIGGKCFLPDINIMAMGKVYKNYKEK